MSDVDTVSGGGGGEVTLAPVVGVEEGYRPRIPDKFMVRMWCGLVFLICGGLLGMGMWLRPDDRNGSHMQLGLPACGFQQVTGYPCPTCSCTTAVSHFSHGELVASFVTQPFGFTVALAAAVALVLAGAGLVTGRWYGPSMFTLGWYWQVWFYALVGIFLAAWGYRVIMVKLGHG